MAKEQKDTPTKPELSCFVIMPISDVSGYDKGHFDVVYEHLIKPACIKAGFAPIRSDDVLKTNYIIVDILKKILESDIALCDMSARNPNVLYELGIRQAFNHPVTLIKDSKTDKIFDIQGLRYVDYDEALRIDSVKKDIVKISGVLRGTYESRETEVNSVIKLLGIESATIPSGFKMSEDTSIVLHAVKEMSARLESLERGITRSEEPWETYEALPRGFRYKFQRSPDIIYPTKTTIRGSDIVTYDHAPEYAAQETKEKIWVDDKLVAIGDFLYISGQFVGTLQSYDDEAIYVQDKDTENVRKVSKKSREYFMLAPKYY